MPVQVIAGNRRLGAATEAGLVSVPVVEFTSTDELDVLEALVHANKQRTKTNEQLGRETQALLYVESELAKRRMQQALVTGNITRHGQSPALADSPEPATEPGNAIDKVADQLGIGRKKAEQARRVVHVIDQLTKDGKHQEAERVRRTLNEKSVHAAYQLVEQAGHIEPASHDRARASAGVEGGEAYKRM